MTFTPAYATAYKAGPDHPAIPPARTEDLVQDVQRSATVRTAGPVPGSMDHVDAQQDGPAQIVCWSVRRIDSVPVALTSVVARMELHATGSPDDARALLVGQASRAALSATLIGLDRIVSASASVRIKDPATDSQVKRINYGLPIPQHYLFSLYK